LFGVTSWVLGAVVVGELPPGAVVPGDPAGFEGFALGFVVEVPGAAPCEVDPLAPGVEAPGVPDEAPLPVDPPPTETAPGRFELGWVEAVAATA
jgi:hypothetical protein